MKFKIKRFDKKLPLPQYAPDYPELAAGFNFICREEVVIPPGETKAIPGNIAIEIPPGYVLLVLPRSSTPSRLNLRMPHSIGVIDPFYRGDENEIMLIFENFSDKAVTVERGMKIAQGIFVRYEQPVWEEVDELGPPIVQTWRKNEEN